MVRAWFFQKTSVSYIEKLVEFWQIFFAFQYILLCCPFLIVKVPPSANNPNCSYKAVVWRPQRILCAIFAITNLFWIQFFVRISLPKRGRNPSEYLNLMSQLNITFLKLFALKIYWWRQNDIVKMLNFISYNNKSYFHEFSLKHRLLEAIIKIVFLSWCCFYFIPSAIEKLVWMRNQNLTGVSWTSVAVNQGRKTFLLETLTSALKPNQSLSTTQVAFAVISQVTHYNQLVFYLNRPIMLLLPLLTLWPLVKAFTDRLRMDVMGKIRNRSLQVVVTEYSRFAKKRKYLFWAGVFEEYEMLKNTAAMINSVFGLAFFCFVVNTILYNSTKFSRYIFVAIDSIDKVFNFSFIVVNFCATFITFALADDICLQVNTCNFGTI